MTWDRVTPFIKSRTRAHHRNSATNDAGFDTNASHYATGGSGAAAAATAAATAAAMAAVDASAASGRAPFADIKKKRNTFQIVYATDGKNGFVFLHYQGSYVYTVFPVISAPGAFETEFVIDF